MPSSRGLGRNSELMHRRCLLPQIPGHGAGIGLPSYHFIMSAFCPHTSQRWEVEVRGSPSSGLDEVTKTDGWV